MPEVRELAVHLGLRIIPKMRIIFWKEIKQGYWVESWEEDTNVIGRTEARRIWKWERVWYTAAQTNVE